MISKLKIKGKDIEGEMIINGCEECMFNEKLGEKGRWCILLKEVLKKYNTIEHYYRCPLKTYHNIKVKYVLHSYSESVPNIIDLIKEADEDENSAKEVNED